MSTDTNDFAKPVSHHISDVDHWGHADRNYYLFVALTFLFGFVGLDHMYLRSNETAFKKLLLNIFGLGIWYVWDVVQVLKDGAYVRKHGLNSPFDWIRGIGRGMFAEPSKKAEKEWAAPKSYFVYTLLALCLGVFGADKFYMGATWQGVAKIFSVFNIFLFLFGILWVIWDAFHAYFDTKGILKGGITPPLPFSWFFGPIKADDFKVQQVKETKEEGGFLGGVLPSFGLRDAYRELMVPVLQPTVGAAIQNAEKVVSVGTKAAALGASALTAGPAFVGTLVDQVAQQAQQTTVEALQKTALNAAANRQQGGGHSSGHSSGQSGPGPILAGALTAIVVAGGLKGFYDFLAKQQG